MNRMEKKMKTKANFLQKYLWFISLVVGGIGALLIWFCLPHQSEIDEFWWLIVKFIICRFLNFKVRQVSVLMDYE